MKNLHPFLKMLIGALAGAIIGIVFGLALSLIIVYINQSLYSGAEMPPLDQGFGTFLGMGFGAVIGAILGGAVMNRKDV